MNERLKEENAKLKEQRGVDKSLPNDQALEDLKKVYPYL
jgi:hypothetical protein